MKTPQERLEELKNTWKTRYVPNEGFDKMIIEMMEQYAEDVVTERINKLEKRMSNVELSLGEP